MTTALSADELTRSINIKELQGADSNGQDRTMGIIGQERAVSALRFGLKIQAFGYNIYVSGPSGSGKMTSVKSFLDEFANSKDTPPDWCYVNNFDDMYSPNIIQLSAGRGGSSNRIWKSLSTASGTICRKRLRPSNIPHSVKIS